MPSFALILAAAGKSTRFKDPHQTKPFVRLDDRAVWLHSIEKFLNRDDVKQLILVIDPAFREAFFDQFGPNVTFMGLQVVDGGEERWQSVYNALNKVNSDIDFVAIHDAARPCLAPAWLDQVFAAAIDTHAAVLATPVTGTLKRGQAIDGKICVDGTVDRQNLWVAQTPQVFQRTLLIDAYQRYIQSQTESGAPKLVPTDDAQVVEAYGHSVTIVASSEMNIKITSREDIKLAHAILKILPRPSFDAPLHPFADDHLWR